jgi:plastocyanin
MLIDDLLINDDVFGPDDMNDMDNWCFSDVQFGDYWEYDSMADAWCIDDIPPLAIEDALVWETEIEDAYEAWLSVEVDWDLKNDSETWYWPYYGALTFYLEYVAYLEISSDGGESWYTLDEYHESGSQTGVYDITFLAGNPLLVRVRVTTDGSVTPDTVNWWAYYYTPQEILYLFTTGGSICVNDMFITGKKDTEAPQSDATLSGTLKPTGWYVTAVAVTITAEDNNAVKEIHYVLDGVETVVAGDTAEFTVSDSGEHDISYWAVDAVGNAESANTIPTFKIDRGEPPEVAITAPAGGLYLFGRKIIDLKSPIIIGPFTVEATASDTESGVYRVQFFLDGDLVGEDTEAPFSAYVATKHMGDGTLKAVAEDFAQNLAEDTLDIKYFKFL